MGIKITMADKWFSLSIQEAYDWTCCRCGTKYHHNHQGLDCSHGYSEGIGAFVSRPSMRDQPVWVVTVLKAVTGWSDC